MTDIRKLLGKVAAQEQKLAETRFFAPRVAGGPVRTRVAGLVYTFACEPADFQGWGVFQALDERRAQLEEEAALPQIAAYLELLKPRRAVLAFPLQGRSWLACTDRPVVVHLVEDAARFDQVVARTDGNAFWFEDLDRRADPAQAERMREALEAPMAPETLRIPNLTPLERMAYEVAYGQRYPRPRPTPHPRPSARPVSDEARLRNALRAGGGELNRYTDRDDHYTVEWTDSRGEHHSSAISKDQLTVLSAGICLDGYDRDFDLQSLVGVVEGR